MNLRSFWWCIAVLGLIGTAAGQERRDRSISGAAQTKYRGGLVTPPLPKPKFVLTDTSGGQFDFRKRTEGSVTLLFFGYTYCPDQCPMHMANLGVALRKLPAGVADQ